MCVGTLVPVGTHAGQRFLPVRLPFFNLLLETSSLIWVDWLINAPLGLVCSLQCFGITDKAPAHLVFIWVLESLNSSPLACTTDTFIHWAFPLPLWSLIFPHLRFLRYTGWHRSATWVSLDSSVFQSLPLKSVCHSLSVYYPSLSFSDWLGKVLMIATCEGPGTVEMVL